MRTSKKEVLQGKVWFTCVHCTRTMLGLHMNLGCSGNNESCEKVSLSASKGSCSCPHVLKVHLFLLLCLCFFIVAWADKAQNPHTLSQKCTEAQKPPHEQSGSPPLNNQPDHRPPSLRPSVTASFSLAILLSELVILPDLPFLQLKAQLFPPLLGDILPCLCFVSRAGQARCPQTLSQQQQENPEEANPPAVHCDI